VIKGNDTYLSKAKANETKKIMKGNQGATLETTTRANRRGENGKMQYATHEFGAGDG